MKSIVAGITLCLLTLTACGQSTDSKSSGSDPVPWQETYAWGQLQDLHSFCKSYWSMEDSDEICSIEAISNPPLNYRKIPVDRAPEDGRVEVVIVSGEEDTFSATARHENSSITWTINADKETTCSLGSEDACLNAKHHSKREVMEEIHHVFGDDVPDDVDSVEFKGTLEEPYVEFERGGK